MASNPSLEQNATKYFLALAAIGRNQEKVPAANLEPQFDLDDAYQKLAREPIDPKYPDDYRRIIDSLDAWLKSKKIRSDAFAPIKRLWPWQMK